MGERVGDRAAGERREGHRRADDAAAQRFALLAESATRLLAAERPDGVLEELCRKLMAHLGCEVHALYLLEASDTRPWRCLSCAGVDQAEVEALASLTLDPGGPGRVTGLGLRLLAGGAESQTTGPLLRLGLSSLASVPLAIAGRRLGALAFGSRAATFDEQELALMEAFAAQLAAALERWRLSAEHERQAAAKAAELQASFEELRVANDRLAEALGERQQFAERLRSVALFPEENPFPVLRISDGGTLLYANQAARDLLASWGCQVGGAAPPVLAGAAGAALGGRRELEVVKADRHYVLTLVPIATHGYINLYGSDVTESKRAEQAIRRAHGRLDHILQTIDQAFYALDREWRFTHLNARAVEFTGKKPEEVLGRTIWEVFPAVAGTPLEAAYRQAMDERVAMHLTNASSVVAGRWYEVDVYPTPEGISIFGRDVTARKRAEEALRESESFYRQTLESIPGMVFTTRPDGYCDYQSQPWVDFTGVPASEHLGDGWSSLLHPDDRPRALAAWQAAVEGRAPYDLEYRVRRHDGAYEWFKVRGRPIHNAAGDVVRWFGTALDIDALVKAEGELRRSHAELEQRVQERTAALARAHARLRKLSRHLVEIQEAERRAIARELHDEAGQVLTALMMNLGALERSALPAGAEADALAAMKDMTARVMEDLHTLSVRLRPAALDRLGLGPALRQLAATAAQGVAVDLEAPGIEGRTLPLEVEASVYRVVQEALTNVARHAGAKRVSVLVSCDGERVVALVEDDGRGFELEAALASGRLGLVGMQERAELLGGRLDIESSPGAGTTVRLELPLAP